jgi:protein TonB
VPPPVDVIPTAAPISAPEVIVPEPPPMPPRINVQRTAPGGITALPGVAGGLAAPPPPPQKIYQLHEGIKPPELQKRVEPTYPALAKAAKMQGPVYVTAIIGKDGRVRDAKAEGGAPFPPLREAAVAAVQQWVYSPTLVNGQPVEVQLSVQVIFKLN